MRIYKFCNIKIRIKGKNKRIDDRSSSFNSNDGKKRKITLKITIKKFLLSKSI